MDFGLADCFEKQKSKQFQMVSNSGQSPVWPAAI